MTATRVKALNNLLHDIPKRPEETQRVPRPGVKRISTRRKKSIQGIVDRTFASLPVKDHKLIEQVIEQSKYGE